MIKDATASLRKKRQRESAKKWLEIHARGLSPDALVTALMRGDWKLVRSARPVTVTKNDKLSKSK